MGINYKFRKAEEIIRESDPDDLKKLGGICQEIQIAEEELLRASQKLMEKCRDGCEGLCCRNIQLDDIITLSDFVYILMVEDQVKETARACLEKESMFSADCIFLKNGKGPCLFPVNARPEKCIVTFCADETPIRKEIRRLASNFDKLSRFILLRKPRVLKKILLKMIRV